MLDLRFHAEGMAGVAGRVAMVTGGGRGIGRATAALLASRGATTGEVAELIVFLATEESSGVNGAAIRISLGRIC